MENYHYLNQKTEIILNQDKLFLPLNNFKYQNFFRGDSNINKQKGRMYNLNNKKEIHFTTRAKDNELAMNGPKMLTMNFPPGFMLTDNNNNSRKTASHEKNIYLQQNMANNMELNEIGSDNEKIFANTFKKGFQDYNDNNNENIYKEKKNTIDIFGQKQKSISIKFNNNENLNNLQKKNVFYTGSGSSQTGFNSTGNTGYIRSETELNSGRGATSSTEKEKEKNYEIFLNHIKTEGDFEQNKNYSNEGLNNYKSSSNSNIPFNIYINSHQNNKINTNLIYNSNLESDINNNYSSNNSNNSKDKFSKNNSFGQKNMNSGSGSSSSNKLVFNPSSITNQRIMKKSSDSEIGPSSISHLYLENKKYKELKKLNNHLSYSNINYNLNKKYNKYYYYNKSEKNIKLSPSQEKSLNSQSKENHTKTQTNFEKKSRPNYYENLIYELENKYPTGSRFNINSAAEYNINILEKFTTKNNINNLNNGILYKINNGYKYFFSIPNGQLYILKEYNKNYEKEILSLIKEWNKKYENDGIFLKIYGDEQDSTIEQNIVIQYPAGGESLNDIINSVGFYDQNYLFDIVTKIYKTIIKIKEDKNNDNYINIPFCLCDIFINVNEHIKIIPPSIRKIQISSNGANNLYNNPCICKYNLTLCQQYFNINKDSISFFCLGFLIIQIITQNLIFEINSYKSIIKKLKTNVNINNNNNYISYNKNNNLIEKKCCLAHLLLESEKQLKGNEYLLFSHFLNLYPKSLLSFLHECTNFKNINPSSSNDFLNLYDTNKNLNLSMKEILEITTLQKNEYIDINVFLNDFKKLFKDVSINSNDYIRKLNYNKVISVLSRSFDFDKEKFMNKMIKIIEENDYDKKNKFKEKNFFEDKKNIHFENVSPFYVGNNKMKNNNDNSNIIFNKQNNLHKLHNYRSSGNYENE